MQPIKIIYCTTVITICSLYAAQPIQPVFQQEFGLSSFQAILFTTLMMAPLGVAPLFYGYLLEAYSAKKLLRRAVLVLGVLELWFCVTDSYTMLLAIRAAQGLVIPAILTSLMSYVSYTVPTKGVQQAIAFYIAATILGGFLGRFLSGILTDLFGWRFFFFILGILFLVCFLLLGKLESHIKLKYVKPRFNQLFAIFKQDRFLWLYLCIFCIFFTFAALMNFLPFELIHISPEYGESGVGFLYVGYSMGILVSVCNKQIRSFFTHETRAIAVGIVIYIIGTASFLIEDYWVMFFGMFVFCTGMFMAHSLLSGYLNTLAIENKAIANGLYMSSYYLGGTLGSFLPGVVREYYGWSAFMGTLIFILCIALFCNLKLNHSVRE